MLGEDGAQLLSNDGTPRVGRGFSESTFRKYYHGLKTLHKHFQKETEYKVGKCLVSLLWSAIKQSLII